MLGRGGSDATDIQLRDATDHTMTRPPPPRPAALPRVLPAVLAVALLGSPGTAGAEDWNFTATPYLWLMGSNGEIEVRGLETRVDDSFFDMLAGTDTLIGGFVHLEGRRDGWGFYLEGNYAYTSTEGELAGAIDTRVRTGLAILEAGGLVEIASGNVGGDPQQGWRIEATAGVRYVSFDVNLDLGPAEVERTLSWTDPVVGLGAKLDLGPDWTVIGHGDIGGFGIGSNLAANLYALVGYRTEIFGAPVLSTVGYRGLYFDREDDGRDNSADLWLHGPVLGLTFAF